VGPKSDLDAIANRKENLSLPLPGIEPRQLSHYIDRAIPNQNSTLKYIMTCTSTVLLTAP